MLFTHLRKLSYLVTVGVYIIVEREGYCFATSWPVCSRMQVPPPQKTAFHIFNQ
jgi:hypothetical protein